MIERRRNQARFKSLGRAAPAIVAVLALAACGSTPVHGPDAPKPGLRPNVLILLADDQRTDTIAALGNPHIRTPNLDRLVRQGTVFSRAYCMGSTQGAVCVPSRAMLMTGRTLFHVKDNLAGQPTWPEAFATAGYTSSPAIRDEQLAPWPRTPEVVRRHLSDYHAAIEHLDAQVGRILDALAASGQAGKTLVVFSSDHGLAIGSHGLFGKQLEADRLSEGPQEAALRPRSRPRRGARPRGRTEPRQRVKGTGQTPG